MAGSEDSESDGSNWTREVEAARAAGAAAGAAEEAAAAPGVAVLAPVAAERAGAAAEAAGAAEEAAAAGGVVFRKTGSLRAGNILLKALQQAAQ